MNITEMRDFIGNEVIVTLAERPELIEFRGVLEGVSPDGDADVRLPDGRFLMVWPVLRVREAD